MELGILTEDLDRALAYHTLRMRERRSQSDPQKLAPDVLPNTTTSTSYVVEPAGILHSIQCIHTCTKL